jgi:hypothetical protein
MKRKINFHRHFRILRKAFSFFLSEHKKHFIVQLGQIKSDNGTPTAAEKEESGKHIMMHVIHSHRHPITASNHHINASAAPIHVTCHTALDTD